MNQIERMDLYTQLEEDFHEAKNPIISKNKKSGKLYYFVMDGKEAVIRKRSVYPIKSLHPFVLGKKVTSAKRTMIIDEYTSFHFEDESSYIRPM